MKRSLALFATLVSRLLNPSFIRVVHLKVNAREVNMNVVIGIQSFWPIDAVDAC